MSPITIDLSREPALKDALANCQPGDKIDLKCSVKSKDDQTVVFTFEEASEPYQADDEEAGDESEAEKLNVPPGKALNEGGNGGKIAAGTEY